MTSKQKPIKPQMFSDEPAEAIFQKAKKLTDFKNFGPEMEKFLLKSGIKTPPQFIKLGWKKTMVQLCKASPKHTHSMVAYAVIGAIKNKMWNAISDEDKLEAREFMKALRDKNAVKPLKQTKKKKK